MSPSPVPPHAPTSARSTADRVWTLWSAAGAVDVAVGAPESATLADVQRTLAATLGLPAVRLWSGSAPLPAVTALTAPELRHGAVLGLGRPGPRDGSDPSSGALELHLTAGPDAGRTVPLGQGSVVVGRGAGCGLTVADPDVSRRHVVVSVGQGRVTVADLGSSNGTCLMAADRPETTVGPQPQEWPVGAHLLIGSTALRLTGPRGTPLERRPAPGGRQLVRPLLISPTPPRGAVVQLPAPPAELTRRRLGWVAVALPAVGGLLMAWLLSTPQFLFFALLSPLVAVAGWASDRFVGRRAHRRAVADHAVARALADAELDAAVAAELAERDEQHPDAARLAAAARRRCSPLWSRAARDDGGLTVRLGCGPAPTTVTRQGADGSRFAVTAEHVPVLLPLGGAGGLGIVGPRSSTLGVARALVCQLAVLASPAQLGVALLCTRERAAEWDWVRWLPHLRAVLSPGEPAPGTVLDSTGEAPRTLVLVDGPVDAPLAEALAGAADRLIRLDVAETEAGLVLPVPTRLEVTGETGAAGRLRLPAGGEERLLVLDALSRATAAGIARDLADLTVPVRSGTLPDSADLLDLATTGLRLDDEGLAVGDWPRGRTHLRAVLGCTGREDVGIDLVADGPHALVAGTTGSGKSELLQTLVAGLALHHPPDRCSFLLVDYKGGAAFGAAAALPHTVGVLTDLDHQSTARALRSLSAELTRRERLLAEHRARDLAELPDSVAAGRLVIVVDEFATLAEELPGFVTGLVGIAQRGRSLGVHLVLATQRPAGVVSPEIRANCSLRICLRTTDESDARDVLGSTLAAQLPPDRPGRAYLRTGATPPVLFQVARVSVTGAAAGPDVRARRRSWPPRPGPPPARPVPGGAATDLQRVVAALAARAGSDCLQPADRPWLTALPDRLEVAALDRWSSGARPCRLLVGLQDLPDAQRQVPLELDLADGGGWLFVGGPRSGRTTALCTVLTEAVRRLTPDRLHVHVLDHGGGAVAQQAAAVPHCGTAVDRTDAHRSARLIARLAEEVDRRRGGAARPDEPLLLVLVDGYESLVAQLEDADPATGAAGLLRVVRDGAAVGVTVVLTADRAVPGSRVAAAVRTRVVLPLPDRADYAVAGVPARSVPGHRPAGRALVGEDAVECQLALPRPLPALTREVRGTSTGEEPHPPIRVVALPADPVLPLPDGGGTGGGPEGLWLALGPGGDEGSPIGLDLRRAGGLLVVGPPGSGRSAALRAFGRHCGQVGAAVLDLGEVDAGELREWTAQLDPARPAVVVADDLTRLPDGVADLLAPTASPAGPLLLIASGTAADLAGTFRGPAVALRRSRTALLLRPAAGDAELLGLRTPRSPLPPRAGAGWLVTPTEVTRVQVARHRTAAASG